jgi:hypothetical protein
MLLLEKRFFNLVVDMQNLKIFNGMVDFVVYYICN